MEKSIVSIINEYFDTMDYTASQSDLVGLFDDLHTNTSVYSKPIEGDLVACQQKTDI